MKEFFSSLIRVFFLILFSFIPISNYAHAEFVSTPNGSTLIANNTINTVLATSSAIYLGGLFTYIGPYSGYGAFVNSSNGTGSTTFPQINGTVSAIVSDGSGGWYVGGTFTQVGSSTRSNVAHILSNSTVDPNFNPSVSASVLALATSSDGTRVYIGGTFTSINTVTYNRLAALNTSDGTAISAFNPNMGSTVSSIALSSDNSTLYAGGAFTTVNSITYNRVAAITTTNGAAVAAFNPNVSNGAVSVVALSSDNATLYAGGSFTTVGGVTHNRIVAVTTLNGALVSAFTPNMSSTVSALALSSDNSTIYVGGAFQLIGGVIYNKLAALTTSNGAAVSGFNPNVASTVSTASVTSIALSSNGSSLYVGGQFTSVGSTAFTGLAKVNTSDGSVDGTFTPNVGTSLNALAVSNDGANIFVGGSFVSIGGAIRNRIAALDVNGTALTSFSPSFSGNGNGFSVNALALSPNGSTLYAGGNFGTLNGVTAAGVSAINVSDGTAVVSFSANNINLTVNTLTLSSDGSKLYAGGSFGGVGGSIYNNLAALNTSDGTAISAFNPNVGSKVFCLALSSDDSKLYFGGQFTTVGGVTYNQLAAVNTSDGTAISSFNPNLAGSLGPTSCILSSDESKIYAGGSFTTVNNITYNRLAIINTSDGSAVSTFNPNVNSTINTLVLSSDRSEFYVGGLFTTISGATFNRLTDISTSDGTASSTFNPNMGNAVSALAFSPDYSKLYAAGSFQSTGSNTATVRFSIFSLATPAALTTEAPSSITDTTAIGNGTITSIGNSDVTTEGMVYGSTATYGATTTTSGDFLTGSFTSSLSDLTCATMYHISAYAQNSGGFAYGPDTTFTTSACPVADTTTTTTTTNTTVRSTSTGRGYFIPTIAVTTSSVQTFTRSLESGMSGTDVKKLQIFLNSQGFTIAKKGAGSPGHETTYFGSLTQKALIKFQKVYGIVPTVGYFGPVTRAKIKILTQ